MLWRYIGILLLLTMTPVAKAVDVVKPLKEERLRVSLAYQFDLLDQALKRSVPKYGPYEERPYTEPMAPARDQREGPRGELINILVAEAGVIRAFDEGMIRIPVSLDKGLHGSRIAFIMKGNQERLNNVKTIEDLRKFTIVQGAGWGDLKVYEHNKIPVSTAVTFDSLLLMLQRGRVELFPRGVNEITAEFDAYRSKFPNLAIEQHLLIKYPFPQYFYVSKSAPRLAERITFGLHEMIKDGSFDALFKKHFAKVIADLQLERRTVIALDNPLLPPSLRQDGKEVWYEPKKLRPVSSATE